MTNAKEETKFVSFCTFDFDPAKNSDCYGVCQKDEPDEFKRCEEHFKAKPVEEKKPRATGGKGKSEWGHVNGSQAGLIDDCLVGATKPETLDAISKFADGRKPRVLHHLKHLVNNKGVSVELTKDGCIFWKDNANMKKLKSFGSVTTLVLRKTPKTEDDK